MDPVPTDEPPPVVAGVELGERIAVGGTSEVWSGVRRADGRRVAVKLVRADLTAVGAAAREASLSAAAASVHVVPVESCLPLADGRVALVMPHLAGGSLAALVRARGHLEPGEVVTVLAPVASALGRFHAMGLVHGDVSPGNVLLDTDGRPHLADLGLAHVLGEVSPGVWGSDGYVAPEVVIGADPTPASDVYSIGALGWLCLTGVVPGAPGLRPLLAEVARAGEGPERESLVEALAAAIDPDPANRPDADTLAWQLFGAAAPTPLHLVRGDDEVSAVTYRLRAAVTATSEPAAGRHVDPLAAVAALRWVVVRLGRAMGPVGAVRAVAPPRAAGERDALRRGERVPPTSRAVLRRAAARRRRFSAAGALLVAVLAAGVVSGAVAGVSRPPSAGAASVAAADPRLDPRAPATHPVLLIEALVDARSEAWRSASSAPLDGADAAGSPAGVRDLEAVEQLRRSGIRYVGLRHEVVEAALVSTTDDRAVVRARVDTSAYLATGPTSHERRPAVAGEPVLVDLVRTAQGWRIGDLRDVG